MRVFTEEEEPPLGETIIMKTESGHILTWNGKRWAWGINVHLNYFDAWPPNAEGPFYEVT